MSRPIYHVVLSTLMIFGLLFGWNELFASIPPHSRVVKLIKEKQISTPYYLQNRKELLKRGVNAPWSSPEIQKQSMNGLSGIERSLGPSRSPHGPWKALAILVKFSDKAQSVDSTSFDNLLFRDSVGTVRNYYKMISYGNLDIVTVNLPSSLGWTVAPQPYAYYVNGQNGFGPYPQNAQKMVEDVIAAVAGSVDFSQYDNDHDGYVDALFVIHSGPGAEFTGNNNDMWSHSWTTSSPQLHNGVYVYRYSTEPEYWMTPGDMTCGVYAHELGHAGFGLPDLYDTDYSSEGLGDWSIMAGGSWNGAAGLGDSPSFPDAWSQFQMGFLTPTNVTSNLLIQPINNTENIPQAYRLWTTGSIGNEYYLVQNRQQVGYDSHLPSSGLLLYHIDETVTTGNDLEWYPGHTSSGHYMVALEQADGIFDLERGVNRGNTGDPYPGSTINRNFTASTLPSSNDYTNTPTHVTVENISNSGSVMTADLRVGIVSGRPVITVTPDTIKLGMVAIGYNRHDTVFVGNVGSESLVVHGITSSLSVYTVSPTSFTLATGEIQPVVITFAPTGSVVYNGVLTIASNDSLHPTVGVVLHGQGYNPPAITVSPDSFAVTIASGDSVYRSMLIGNTGVGVLNWSVNVLTSPSQMSVMEAVNGMRRNAVQPLNQTQQASMISKSQSTIDKNWTAEKAVSSKVSLMQVGMDIAIVDAEDLSRVEDIQSKLLASGQFNSVTLIDGGSVTPTLTQLQAFKAVLVFSDYMWLDRSAMGNVLASYIEGGGGVVCGVFATAGVPMSDPGGNFSQYQLMTFGSSTSSTGSLGTVYLPSHVLMQGVTTFATGSLGFRPVNTTVSTGAVKVADWNDGSPLIVYKDNVGPMNAHRVDLGFFPVSDDAAPGSWLPATGGAKIMANALLYAGGGGAWVSAVPNSGVIAPGLSQNVAVKFDAKSLIGGDYRQVISISSNDPVNNPKQVPANLHVVGKPAIAVVPDTLNASVVYIGTTYVDTVRVKNTGSDVLNVVNISSNLPVFTAGITSFSVAPGKDQAVAVRFVPTDTIAYNGVLTIISNDSLHPTVSVVLQGDGVYPPVISVTPSSLSANLLTGQSTTRTLTISNTGLSDLRFDATIGFSGSSSSHKSFASNRAASSSSKGSIQAGAEYKPNQVIVKFKKGVSSAQTTSMRSNIHAIVAKKFSMIGAELWNLTGVTVVDAITQYKDNPQIEYIEPNYIVHASDRIPNDPDFSQLWGMQKISAPAAWDRITGSNIVIGDIDTGIDTNHVDLRANLWTNPGEIPGNGIDDDGNGFIDDVHGWNFCNNTNNVYDDNGHGTHTAGTIAAVGNNGVGVVGVCWSAKIMALKFLDASGSGTDAGAVSAIEYATMMHARLTSNSWGGGGYSQALYDAIKAAGDAGALFVAAAGNSSMNTDIYPNYPSGYDLDNIIAVASTNSTDGLSSFSNYGLATVDLGAPGENIYSTLPGNSYGTHSGTSMATPHVSGAAGLILSLNPLLNWAEIKNIILSSVDSISSLTGKTVTGGRLNAARAILKTQTWIKLSPLSATVPPSSSFDVTATFDAANMNGGDYLSTIKINNNDPLHNVVDVPASLHVTGKPVISVVPDTVKAGMAFVGITHIDSVKVRNIGTDILNVANITSSQPVFTADITTFSVSPGQEQIVKVNFLPTDTVASQGVLTIVSNDSLRPTAEVVLIGHGAYPPVISVSPDSFAVILAQGDSTTRTLTIGNTGRGQLSWSVDAGTISSLSLVSPRTMSRYTLPMWTVLNGVNFNVDRKTTMSFPNKKMSLVGVAHVSNILKAQLVNLNGVRVMFDYAHSSIEDTTFFRTILQDLRARGATISLNTVPFTVASLSNFAIIIITEGIGTYTSDELTALQNWINNGGGLILEGDEFTGNLPNHITTYGIQYLFIPGSSGYSTKITPHPVTLGCDTIFLSNPLNSLSTTSPAQTIVYDVANVPHIAVSHYGNGHVAVIADDDFAEGIIQYADNRLLANQLVDWMVGGASWLSAAPMGGTIVPDSNQNVTLKFNAKDLSGGDYRSVLAIKSNDPINSPKNVPASLHVIGRPVISVIPDTVKAGTVYIGWNHLDTVKVKNLGSDVLNVTSITSNLPAFTTGAASFSVPAGSEHPVVVTFTPIDSIAYNGTLTIASNDSLHPTVGIGLQGQGAYPPVITVSPDSFAVTLAQGDSTGRTIRIGNIGKSPLEFTLVNRYSSVSTRTNSQPKTIVIQRPSSNMGNRVEASGFPRTVVISPATSSPRILTIDAGLAENTGALNLLGYTYTKVTPAAFATQNLSDYDVLYVGWLVGSSSTASQALYDRRADIRNFVLAGGGLVALANPSGSSSVGWTWTPVPIGAQDQSTDFIHIVDSTHPIMDSLSDALLSNWSISSHNDFTSFDASLEVLANSSLISNQPVMLSGTLGAGRVVFTGMDPDYHYYYNGSIGAGKLLKNMLDWSAQKGSWLSEQPMSGVVLPGSTEDINVFFKAKSVPSGNYQAAIVINNNDPLHNSKNVTAKMHVIGKPVIAVLPDTLKYNPVYVGVTSIDTLHIRNTGTDALQVNSIIASDTAFHPNKTSFVVSSGGQENVLIKFRPSTASVLAATITITSNDSTTLTTIVPIRGEAFYPSVITVSPDSFAVSIGKNDSTTRTLTIQNTGMGSLIWSTGLQGQGMSPLYKKYLEELYAIPFVAESKGQTVDNLGPPVEFSMGGPDSAGYRWIDSDQPGGPTFNWTDIKAMGTLISLSGDDNNAGPFPIGFNFAFYGSTFSQFRICTNGWISFTSNLITFSNFRLPSTLAPVNLIAAFWDDLVFNSNSAYYYNDGTKLTIQYDSVQQLGAGSSKYTFQIILYPSGDIKLQYLTMIGNVNSSTVGIQNQTAAIGLTVVYNASYLHNNHAILISKTPSSFFTLSPTNGTILSGQSQSVTVKFNAKGMLEGEYRSVLSIASNDPLHSSKSIPMRLVVDSIGSDVVENRPEIPREFALHQNYPNPFNPSTTIQYALPARSRVKLQIFNMLGQRVIELVSSEQNAGYQSVIWNANVASGIYFYRIEARAIQDPGKYFVSVKKMLLLK